MTSAPNTGSTTADRASPKMKNESIASSPLEKRTVLVYIDGDDLPTLFRLSDAISTESGATSSSVAPQLSVLKANIEKRLAPRVVDWSRLATDMAGLHIRCDHQDAFAIVCEQTEQERYITLRGLKVSAAPTAPDTDLSGTLNILSVE